MKTIFFYNKKNIRLFFSNMLLLCCFFVNEDILIFQGINGSNLLINIRYAVQIITTVGMLGYCIVCRISIQKKRLLIFGLFLAMILLTMIANMDFRAGYLFAIMICLDCVLLLSIFSADEIFSFLYRFMYVACLVSIVFHMIDRIYPQLLTLLPTIVVNKNNFYFAGLTNVIYRYDAFLRNWGMFREPGVFQAFIALPLIYGVFRKKDPKLKEIVVFMLALITTFSTTGYLVLIMILLALVLENKKKMTTVQRRIISGTLLVAFAAFLYLGIFTDFLYKDGYGSVFGKLAMGLNSISTGSRIASISVNAHMMLSSPLWGKGMTYVEEYFTPLSQELLGMKAVDNTNMIFLLGAKYGFPMFVFVLYRLASGLKSAFGKGNLVKLVIFGSILLITFGEHFQYSMLMFILLFFIDSDFKQNTPLVCDVALTEKGEKHGSYKQD